MISRTVCFLGCLLSLPVAYCFWSSAVLGGIPNYGRNFLLIGFLLILFFCNREPMDGLRKNYFRPFSLFVIAFTCAHFQPFLDLYLGFAEENIRAFRHSYAIAKVLPLAVLGFSSFGLGFFWPARSRGRLLYDHRSPSVNFSLLGIFFVISLGVYIASLRAGNFSTYDGGGGNKGVLVSYASIVLVACISVYLSLQVRRLLDEGFSGLSPWDFIRFLGWGNIPVAIIVALQIIAGGRSMAIAIFCQYAFAYLIVSRRKIRLLPFVLLFVGATFILTFLGLARSFQGGKIEAGFEAIVSEEFSNTSISPLTAGLSAVNPLLIQVENVPAVYPYAYGKYQLTYVVGAIPFANRIVGKYLGLGGGTAYFASVVDQGENFSSGVGTSCVGDLYCDAGVGAVVIGMFFLGLLLRKTEVWIWREDYRSLSTVKILFLLVFLGNIVFLPRGEILSFVKPFFFAFVIYKVVAGGRR